MLTVTPIKFNNNNKLSFSLVFAANIASVVVVDRTSAIISFREIIPECDGNQILVQYLMCDNCDCTTVDFSGAMTQAHTIGSGPLIISSLMAGTIYCYQSHQQPPSLLVV